jgi:rifampicin phosphotransferase
MTTIVRLSPRADEHNVGGKFANLGRAATVAAVPWAVCVPVSTLERCLGEERLVELDQLLLELRATVGYGIADVDARIETILAGLAADDALRQELEEVLTTRCEKAYAVRASVLAPDTAGSAMAGAQRAILDVAATDVADAIVRTWRAAYSPHALAARLSCDQSVQRGIAVVVQEHVKDAERVVVLAAASGQVASAASFVSPGAAAAASRVAALWGRNVEVESLSARRPGVIQVRPVDSLDTPRPRFEHASLYAERLPAAFALGSVTPIYTHYVTKRGRAYKAAAAARVPTGAAHVLSFNGSGLANAAPRLRQLLAETPHERVVIDVSPELRQIVLAKDDAVSFLLELFGSASRDYKVDAAIVRDFVTGPGVIGRLGGDGGLLLEWAEEGLMALNRGVAGARSVVFDADGNPVGDTILQALARELPTIRAFTKTLDEGHAGIQTEWALAGGRAHFVDYTASRAQAVVGDVMSAGSARGPAVVLDDDLLRSLSIGPALSAGDANAGAAKAVVDQLATRVRSSPRRPIIVAPRPYAILAALIDDAAGFVFAEGSVLCHLAITLREYRRPAVVSSARIRDGDELHLEEGKLAVLRSDRRDTGLTEEGAC